MNRRILLQGAIASAATLSAAGASAAVPDRDLRALKQAVDAGYDGAIRRIQDWIKLPTIAAEKVNIEEGADYFAKLATDAGFGKVRKVRTGLREVQLGFAEFLYELAAT